MIEELKNTFHTRVISNRTLNFGKFFILTILSVNISFKFTYKTMQLKFFMFVFLSGFLYPLSAQNNKSAVKDTIFYCMNKGHIHECVREDAIGYGFKTKFNPDVYLKKVFYKSVNKPMITYVVCDTFLLNKIKKPEVIITQRVGDYIEWYENGQKRKECTYQNDMLDGELKMYNENGALSRLEIWKNGVWISGETYDNEGKHDAKCAYQNEAKFKGGEVAFYKYLFKKLDDKKLSNRFDRQHRVLIGFLINEKGQIEDIRLINGQSTDFENQIVNIFREMPDWIPAYAEGKPVKTYRVVPFRFTNAEAW